MYDVRLVLATTAWPNQCTKVKIIRLVTKLRPAQGVRVFFSFSYFLRSVTIYFLQLFFSQFYLSVSCFFSFVVLTSLNVCVSFPGTALIDTRAHTHTHAVIHSFAHTFSLSLSFPFFSVYVFTRRCEFTIMVIRGCRRCPLLPGQQDSWCSRSFLLFLLPITEARFLENDHKPMVRSPDNVRFVLIFIFALVCFSVDTATRSSARFSNEKRKVRFLLFSVRGIQKGSFLLMWWNAGEMFFLLSSCVDDCIGVRTDYMHLNRVRIQMLVAKSGTQKTTRPIT